MTVTLKDTMKAYGSKINIGENSPIYPQVVDKSKVFTDGSFIYKDEEDYYYVVMERGKVVEKFSEKTIKGILYPVFDDITFRLASDYELKHRVANQDTRRLLFAKQLELLSKISTEYKSELEKYFEQILVAAPFVDK